MHEMLIQHMLPLSCYMKNLQYYLFHLNCGPKFTRFESSWLQHVGALLAREGLQNTHHWSERTETATENGVGQLDHVVIAAAICQWCRW